MKYLRDKDRFYASEVVPLENESSDCTDDYDIIDDFVGAST